MIKKFGKVLCIFGVLAITAGCGVSSVATERDIESVRGDLNMPEPSLSPPAAHTAQGVSQP